MAAQINSVDELPTTTSEAPTSIPLLPLSRDDSCWEMKEARSSLSVSIVPDTDNTHASDTDNTHASACFRPSLSQTVLLLSHTD